LGYVLGGYEVVGAGVVAGVRTIIVPVMVVLVDVTVDVTRVIGDDMVVGFIIGIVHKSPPFCDFG